MFLFLLFSCALNPNNPLSTDDDGDGYSEFDGDCDDNDPNSTIEANDADLRYNSNRRRLQ